MRIDRIIIENFRIYKGLTEVDLKSTNDKNISIIAGKNGFGKTTFLTSLIWCFYGKLMSQVEDKYKQDIRNSGGYEAYMNSLLNRDVIRDGTHINKLSVQIELEDLLIPSIPCKTVTIKREYDYNNLEETVIILIDGDENELTKSVGYEVFINDFILPREIAKFFFFDAEKIVSLAEAKSRSELRNLSKAYSEVLGIKKYEELKKNLESLLIKLKRRGVSELQQEKLNQLLNEENELEKQINHNHDKQVDLDKQLILLKSKSDSLQEKLIREGNSITLDELKELKSRRDELKQESIQIKSGLKKLLDLTPLVIAGRHLNRLKEQLDAESNFIYGSNTALLSKELKAFTNSILNSVSAIKLEKTIDTEIKRAIQRTLEVKLDSTANDIPRKILLEFTEEKYREFEAILSNIKNTFLSQFNSLVKEERTNRALLSRTINKIKQAEARKDNHLARQFRNEKQETESSIKKLLSEKDQLNEELGALKLKLSSHTKVRVEYEKNFNLIETDKKKYAVTQTLLDKINKLIVKIKEEKKYSLQKSIALGLGKLMHKKDFISNVKVNIVDDVMDINLLDKENNVIDKDSLSKGEQQLYATALLKALVDESGIKFPVFIDSPLQKFDKFHSKNIIQEFYPSISEQVVLFPLLEKELSEKEYELLKPNLSKVFLIQNNLGASTLKVLPVNNLFKEFKKEKDVYSY